MACTSICTRVRVEKYQTLAAIPLFEHTEILHTLVGMGRAALTSSVERKQHNQRLDTFYKSLENCLKKVYMNYYTTCSYCFSPKQEHAFIRCKCKLFYIMLGSGRTNRTYIRSHHPLPLTPLPPPSQLPTPIPTQPNRARCSVITPRHTWSDIDRDERDCIALIGPGE